MQHGKSTDWIRTPRAKGMQAARRMSWGSVRGWGYGGNVCVLLECACSSPRRRLNRDRVVAARDGAELSIQLQPGHMYVQQKNGT